MNQRNKKFDFSEEEFHDEIWEEFDSFLYKTGRPPSRLHLPFDVDERNPYCHMTVDRSAYDYISKPVSAYPKGWRSICRDCILNWTTEEND